MAKQTKNKYSNAQLVDICRHGIDYLEEILDYFHVDYRAKGNCLLAPCPIHGGDNKTAFNVYVDNEIPGAWICNTHHCEQDYWQNLIGLVHALLSRANPNQDINDSIEWLQIFSKHKPGKLADTKQYCHQNNFTRIKKKRIVKTWDRKDVVKSLTIPSSYYMRRKYSTYILQKYDVGIHEKYNRTYFPVYNDDYMLAVGFVSRSVYDKCQKCGFYHNPQIACPIKPYKEHSKWINSPVDFPKSEYLFNHWFARPYLTKSSTAILVEGPGDVLRLEDNNIHHSVAIFGTSLTQQQRQILEKDGVINLIILMDNDDAGQKAKDKMQKELGRDFRLQFPKLVGEDIGDGNVEDIMTIKELLK